MATITYHTRYLGESGPRAKFTQRHYWVIANILKDSNADWGTVEAFVEALGKDNPNFKPDLFIKAST